MAHGKVKQVFARHVQQRRQHAQAHVAAHVPGLDGPAPVVEVHGVIHADALGQIRLDVFLEIGRADDLAGLLVVAEADDDACGLALGAVVFHQIADAGHGLVVMVHAIDFFIDRLVRALRADEHRRDAEVDELFVDENGVGGQVNVLESGLHGVIHLLQNAGVHERVADDGREVETAAAERRPFVHGLLEHLERHDAGLEGLVGDDLRVGAEGALGVADVRDAGDEVAGRHELAVFEKFLRRDVVFGEPVVLPCAEKVLDVERAPINEISRHAVRVNEVVDAPADFADQTFHAVNVMMEG